MLKLSDLFQFSLEMFMPGLPNLFSVAGHFHLKKFIAGHKRFCDVKICYFDVTNLLILFYAITRGDNKSYSCTQCCQLVWM